MNRSQIRPKRTRHLYRFRNEIRSWVKHHDVISGIIAWLIASILDKLGYVNVYLGKPFSWIGVWNPKNPLLSWLEFSLLLLVYIGTLRISWKLLRRILGYRPPELLRPRIIYEDEIAAAAQALDQPAMSTQYVKERVEDLMYTIADTVTAAIGVPPKYYRAYFVVNNGGATDISGFRIGRQFKIAEKHGEPIDKILDSDAGIIDRVLQRSRTVSVMREVQEEFPESDVHQVIMIRNPGNFRMAFLIVIIDPEMTINENDETFLQVSYIIRTLGFMDNLVNYVLQYE